MATMESFYQWLISLFNEGENLDYEQIKYRLEEAGYDDVKAEDVYNAVNTMIDDGDVFTNEQSSLLEAYTGGNVVSQGGYQGASSAGSSGGGSSSSSAPSASSASAPSAAAAPSAASVPVPPPPPLSSPAYESDLEAAIEQITYVNNVTNNTYNEDNDYFSDDDTVVDNSVNQNIVAAGDVHQDFDNVTASGEAVANSGEIHDSNVITGGVEDSVVGDDVNLEGSAVGDGNTILNDSDGAVLGEGGTSITNSDVNAPVATGGGDAIQAEQVAGGDAIQAHDSNVSTGEGDLINDSNANTGDGDFTQTNIDAEHSNVNANTNTGEGNLVDADNSVASGEGDVEGINQSQVEAAEFGEGDLSADDNIIDDSAGAAINTGEHGEAEGEFEENFEQQNVDIDHSAGIGVSDDGPAEGEFTTDVEVDVEDLQHAEPEHQDEMTDV